MSPKHYHTIARIKRAALLLEKQEGSISEISWLLGFESIYHFSRVFKQILGVPPREYINNINKYSGFSYIEGVITKKIGN